MKIVITGKNSHIGNKIQKWLETHQVDDAFVVEQLDVVGDEWMKYDFRGTDAIVHVAAIVHQPKLNDWDLYHRVNVELPVKIAQNAKKAGVKQYVFFSTMAVFGWGKKLNTNQIEEKTIPKPQGMYGNSKYEAEMELQKIEDENFLLSIVRPPNVYGENGKLGYVDKFAKMLKYWRIFPDVYREVEQSMIFIDNLTELIRQIIIRRESGIFMPQDKSPVSTMHLIETICAAKGYKIMKSTFLGYCIKPFKNVPIVQKFYGGVAYSSKLSEIEGMDYVCKPFEQGIKEALIH